MLYFCQKLLNFQGIQALIQVRSLSNVRNITSDDMAGLIGLEQIFYEEFI